VFFCCFQLWPLFPSDRLMRCSVESNTDATHSALKTIFSIWSCEVASRRMIGEDIDWLLWFLLDDYHLKLKVGCRIDVKAKLFRRQNANKDISHCLNIFLSLLTVLLLLSWWLQTWMDGNINSDKEFAGMSRRQVHGDKFAEATNTDVTATWFAFIERDIYIHQWYVRWKILCSDIWHHMDDGYFTERYELSGLFIYERHFCLDMSEESSVQLTMYCSNILFGWILTYGEKLYRCDYCLLMLVDYFSIVS